VIRFAVIGLGAMGRTHLASLVHHPEAQVSAVCDADPERLAGPLAPGGGNIDTGSAGWSEADPARRADPDEVLVDDSVEAVVVATPSDLHAELSCRALAAGKHVFCEKPMALTSADAERMRSAAAAADRRLMIGHVLRFWGEYAAAAEVVGDGRFGRLRAGSFTRLCETPGYGARSWFQDAARSGGALFDLHVHDSDYALSLLGPPGQIDAAGRTGPSGGYDLVLSRWRYGEGGPDLHLECAWAAGAGSGFAMGFRLYFERGTIDYRSDRKAALRMSGPDGPVEPAVPPAGGYQREMAHFIECIRAGADSEVAPPISSRKAVALTEATAESIRAGRTVEVDLDGPAGGNR
jgi:predicted dehydrogenase